MIYIIAAILLVLIYLNLNYRLGYWGRRNVPFISSSVPSAIVFLFHSPGSLFDHFARIYNHFKGCKYGGIYRLFSPQFVVLDPELIKQILVKDFEYFRDRGNVTFDQHDPITNHLFSSPGDLWRGKFRQKYPRPTFEYEYLNILMEKQYSYFIGSYMSLFGERHPV